MEYGPQGVGALLNDMLLRVTPEELYAVSSGAMGRIVTIRARLGAMEERVKGTVSYWQGAAGDIHRGTFKESREEMEELLAEAAAHITDLEKIAGVYQETEHAAQSIVEQLPTDIIF